MPRTDVAAQSDPLAAPLDPQKIVSNLQQQSKGGSLSDAYKNFVAPLIPNVSADPKFEKRVADPLGTIFGNANQPGALGDIIKGITSDITGGGSKKPKKKAATTADTPPPTGQAQPQQPAPDDVLTAGLGMFFAQYLAPMMQQINSQNQGLISQYGNAMNQALSQQLPAGVASVMKPYLAQNEQLMTLANNAGAQMVAGSVPFNSLLNSLSMEGQGLQAAASALPTAAANQALATGGSTAVGQMLANMGIANTPYGAGILSLLSQPSALQNLLGGSTGSSKSSKSSSSQAQQLPQQSVTPITVLPAQQQPAAANTATQNPAMSNLANTYYAQQLAQAMLNNQPNAAVANTLAGTGYTPR